MRARRLERSSSLEIQTRGAAVASARGSLARISLALASILAASLAGGCSAASEGRAPAADGRRPAGSLDPPGDLARGDPAGGDAARGGAFRGDAPRGDPGGREAARADPAPSGDGIGRPLEPFPPCAWSLKDAQREARRRNPTADRLEARIAAAAAREGQIRSAFYPRLHTSGQYLRLDEEVAFRDPLGTVYVVQDREAYTQVTSLTYNVWDWGETWFAAHAGSLDTQRERVLGRRALQALDFQVARLFFAILETEQEIEVQAASVATLQGALDLARSLRDVGRGTEADVLVVEVSLERGKYHQRWLQDRLDDLRDELRLLLELPLHAPMELEPAGGPAIAAGAASADGEEPAELESAAWEELALEHREELRALRFSRDGLAASRRAVLSEYLPRVDLFVRHEYSTTESAFRDPDFFSGGVSASWEIFSGLRRRHRSREIDARILELSAEERALRAQMVGEVRSALRSERRAADGIAVAERGVRQAEENLDRVTERFRSGKASGQEVLEAESLVRAERAREVAARFALLRSREAIRFACGLDHDQEPRVLLEAAGRAESE